MNKKKIVIFSDLHYSPELPTNHGARIGRKLIQYSLPVLEEIINEINYVIKPDIVLNLGDLIEDCNNHDKDIENLNYIWSKLKRINAPFYSAIGNHDLRSMSSRREVEGIMGYDHSTYSIDICGIHLVFLGTYVNHQIGNGAGGILKTQFISIEDMKWLENDLKRNKFPVLVCVHFGIAEDNMKGNWWFENCPERALLSNRKEVKEILKKDKNVIGVFSGHQHWTKKVVEDDIPYYVVGSLIENIKDDGVPDGVYFIIEFDGENLEVIEKHIKEDESNIL